MNKKYELTDQSIEIDGRTLYRIIALKDLPYLEDLRFPICVKKGDLGGFIEKEENLSHEGNSWVGEYSKVY